MHIHTDGVPGSAAARPFQVAYVTRNLEAGCRVWSARTPVADWKLIEATIPLDGADASLRVALAFFGAVQIELIEPAGGRDDLYRDALPTTDGALRLHHLGFKAASQEDLAALHRAIAGRGERTLVGGDGGIDSSAFFYHDDRLRLGHYIEYLYLNPLREAFHAALPRN